MDENQTVNQQPITTQQSPIVQEPKRNKNLSVLFIFLIVIVIGGVTTFLLMNKAASPAPVYKPPATYQLPSATPVVTQTPEMLLQQMSIESIDAEMQSINEDLQQL